MIQLIENTTGKVGAQKDYIMLAELINAAIEYTKPNGNKELYNDIRNRMVITSYLPLIKKNLIVNKVMMSIETVEDLESSGLSILEKEKSIFFYGLLEGYCGIVLGNEELINYDAYDLLFPLFAEEILEVSGADYQVLLRMVDSTMSINYMSNLSSILNSLDYEKIERFTQLNNKSLQELEQNTKLVESLSQIFLATNPKAQMIADLMQKNT